MSASMQDRHILRVYFEGQKTYRTILTTRATTAAELRDRVAKKLLLDPEKVRLYTILLLTRRRPQSARIHKVEEYESFAKTLSEGTQLNRSFSGNSRTKARLSRVWDPSSIHNRLQRYWHSARTLEDDECLYDLIEMDRYLRYGGQAVEKQPEEKPLDSRPRVKSLNEDGCLMFMFKDSRIPLNVGSQFCGTSGEEDGGEEESSEATCIDMSSHKSNLVPAALDDLCALSKGVTASERFVIGLPLEPKSRNSRNYTKSRRPSDRVATENGGVFDPQWSNDDFSNFSGPDYSQDAVLETQKPHFSGYLFRRSQRDRLIWYRRWCVIKDDCLWCCKSRHNQRHIMRINLAHNVVQLSSQAKKNRSMRYCIEIQTARRVYYFRARNSGERDQWLRWLQHQVALATENESMKLAGLIIRDQEDRYSFRDESRLSAVSSSIAGLLEDEGSRQLFGECLRDWHCPETLYFWCDVEEWSEAVAALKRNQGSSDSVTEESSAYALWQRASDIYDAYLRPQIAEFELFIAPEDRTAVEAILQERAEKLKLNSADDSEGIPPADLFCKIQARILEDMRRGPYQRLVGTESGRHRLALLSVLDPLGKT